MSVYPFPKCYCGYEIGERDLDPVEQRKYELHMLAEIASALQGIADILDSRSITVRADR